MAHELSKKLEALGPYTNLERLDKIITDWLRSKQTDIARYLEVSSGAKAGLGLALGLTNEEPKKWICEKHGWNSTVWPCKVCAAGPQEAVERGKECKCTGHDTFYWASDLQPFQNPENWKFCPDCGARKRPQPPKVEEELARLIYNLRKDRHCHPETWEEVNAFIRTNLLAEAIGILQFLKDRGFTRAGSAHRTGGE